MQALVGEAACMLKMKACVCRYGFINAAYLHQAIFLLLSSVVLLSDRDWLHELSEIGQCLL